MKFPGIGNQQKQDWLYRADGSITTASAPQLVLGRSAARSSVIFQNTSNSTMWVEVGWGAGTATVSGGVVTGVSISNAGFGYTYPPRILLFGGGQVNNAPNYLGLNQPNGHAPKHPAQALSSISGGSISGVTVNDPGSAYATAPYVHIVGSDLDPYGCAAPAAGVGMQVLPGQSLSWAGMTCPTDPVAVWCATQGATFICRWTD